MTCSRLTVVALSVLFSQGLPLLAQGAYLLQLALQLLYALLERGEGRGREREREGERGGGERERGERKHVASIHLYRTHCSTFRTSCKL